ncbi:hypothetical protein C0995_009941 [Termitomyces sp. Mi166|nr:hypothetical protein C0995_009941 [Termitomyces sp. Mi166\
MSTEDITSLLISDPSRRHDPENSPDGMVQAAVSQPLPLPSFEDAMKSTFLLGDYSHGRLLFDWTPLPDYQLNESANLLYQMMNVTGERFSLDQLSKGQKTGDYFNENGHLLSLPPYVDDSYTAKVRKSGEGDLSDMEILSTCQLLS